MDLSTAVDSTTTLAGQPAVAAVSRSKASNDENSGRAPSAAAAGSIKKKTLAQYSAERQHVKKSEKPSASESGTRSSVFSAVSKEKEVTFRTPTPPGDAPEDSQRRGSEPVTEVSTRLGNLPVEKIIVAGK
jgi:hypothetical protein